MREVKYTTRFQRDYRREKTGRHRKKLDAMLTEAVNLLAADMPLPHRNFDHPLSGEWNDHRDCRIRPDLVLIYASAHMVSPGFEKTARQILWSYTKI
jgi:mRNA interferase YafQ